MSAVTTATAAAPIEGLHARTNTDTLGRLVLATTARQGGAPALRHHVDGEWHDVSYAELGTIAREIAAGLIALGVVPGDPVGLLAATRPEWTMVDCGALCAGAVVVPVYHTNSPAECLHVLGHSGARVVFCEDAAQRDKVLAVRDQLPELEHIVTFDDSGEISLAQLRERASEVPADAVDRAVAAVRPDDVATIVYTSGTTGAAKGCLTTHTNCIATIAMYEQQLDLGTSDRPLVIFLFLPLAHSLTRMTQMVALDAGGTLAYWRGDMQRVVEDLAEIRPTHVPSVPRVLEKIHTRVLAGAQDAGPIKGAIAGWSLGIGRRMRAAQRRGQSPKPALKVAHHLADRLVLARVRGVFGDRLELALTGAAPINHEVLEFFDACGVVVLEGYGMTETTAAATLNTTSHVRFGTVGQPLPATEVAIAPDGEILMRGPHIFAGYHRDPEATRATMTEDGWLRSGDLGSIDADGYVRVTGRKKDLIITSSGKNITPAMLEAALADRRWISQAVVYGDNRPYVVALVTLDPRQAPELARRCAVAPDVATLAADAGVRATIQAEIDAANTDFARVEQVKRFAILDHDLTQEAGEVTPTAKIRRNVVYERYAPVFDALYEDEEAQR
jgi:long-chain acyl-CoA synthetase